MKVSTSGTLELQSRSRFHVLEITKHRIEIITTPARRVNDGFLQIPGPEQAEHQIRLHSLVASVTLLPLKMTRLNIVTLIEPFM